MTLVLEIEHLLGVAFAAQNPARSEPDWPPQPDRVFSALVAAWGARGERPEERRALEWLEAQAVPELMASSGAARTAVTAYVPPNDPETGRVGNRTVLPVLRRRQPRRFPAFRPDDPVIRLVWRDAATDNETYAALNSLAGDTPYVGHSSSLTRCRFHRDAVTGSTVPPRRWVYRGRLAELERDFHAGRRPSVGIDVPAAPIAAPIPTCSTFGDQWLVLEYVGDRTLDLLPAAPISKELRNTLMSGYRQTAGEDAVPAAVSGHAADGAPLSHEHLAIVPLSFLGMKHADGHVLGFALIAPRGSDLLDDPGFHRAVRAVSPWNDVEGRRELRLRGHELRFTPSPDAGLRSLDPKPYIATARTWATCTPIVLDRHLKAKGNAAREQEIQDLVAKACLDIGLPMPARWHNGDKGREELAIAPGKHSAFHGAPPARPSARSPDWTKWQLPASLASRPLTHAVLQFDEPVQGPIILGAGRFMGLGLCRALDPETP